MKFPIYRVEIDLYFDDEDDPVQCRQDMMLRTKLSGDDALTSIRRVAQNLAAKLAEPMDRPVILRSWDGFIAFGRWDTWCLHWKSHYTYYRFPTPADALTSFVEYKKRHPDEIETDLSEWNVCPCEVCEALGRTIILHSGAQACKTCFSVSC